MVRPGAPNKALWPEFPVRFALIWWLGVKRRIPFLRPDDLVYRIFYSMCLEAPTLEHRQAGLTPDLSKAVDEPKPPMEEPDLTFREPGPLAWTRKGDLLKVGGQVAGIHSVPFGVSIHRNPLEGEH